MPPFSVKYLWLYLVLMLGAALSGCADSDKPHTDTPSQASTPLPTLMGMASAAASAGDPLNAISVYERARKLYPGAPEPLVGLANTSLAIGRTEKAEALYREALNLDGTQVEARHGLARAFMVTDRPAQADVCRL